MEIWTHDQEAVNLSKLFEGVGNKAAFAREHKVPGGASMLSQNCSGNRPISLEAAIAYAKGFGLGLERISPRLAFQLAQIQPSVGTAPAAPASLSEALELVANALEALPEAARLEAAPLLQAMTLAPDSKRLRGSLLAVLMKR